MQDSPPTHRQLYSGLVALAAVIAASMLAAEAEHGGPDAAYAVPGTLGSLLTRAVVAGDTTGEPAGIPLPSEPAGIPLPNEVEPGVPVGEPNELRLRDLEGLEFVEFIGGSSFTLHLPPPVR